MVAACAAHIPVSRLPAHVEVIRAGQRLEPNGKLFLQRGDQIQDGSPGQFTFTYAGNQYRVIHGRLRLDCRQLRLGAGASRRRPTVLAVHLLSGRVNVLAGGLARRALVLTGEMLALAKHRGTDYVVDRNPSASRTRAWTLNDPIVAASASDPALRIDSQVTYTGIADRRGLRLDVWPFPISSAQRRPRPADGLV